MDENKFINEHTYTYICILTHMYELIMNETVGYKRIAIEKKEQNTFDLFQFIPLTYLRLFLKNLVTTNTLESSLIEL